MQKIRKILRAVSEKTALPTNQPSNQPIITNNTDFIGPGWRRSKKRFCKIPWNLDNSKLCLNHIQSILQG